MRGGTGIVAVILFYLFPLFIFIYFHVHIHYLPCLLVHLTLIVFCTLLSRKLQQYFFCKTSVPICQTLQCHIPEDSNRHVCSCSVFGSFIHRAVELTSPTVLLVLQIILSSVKLYLPLRVDCYRAVWNETAVDFDVFKIGVLFFKNKLYFSLLILRLFYVFVAGISYILVAKRGASHRKLVLIFVTVIMVAVNHENQDFTILLACLHSVVLFAF